MQFSITWINVTEKHENCNLRYLFLIIISVFLLLKASVQAAPLTLEDSKDTYSVGSYLEIFEDKEGLLTIDDITNKKAIVNFTKNSAETPSYGFTDSVFWARLHLKNNLTTKKIWLIEMSYAPLDYIELYIPDDKMKFVVKTGGDMIPFSKREIQYHNNIFNLPEHLDRELTIYFRFKTSGPMEFPLKIWSSSAFLQNVNRGTLALATLLRHHACHGILQSFYLYNG